MHRIATLGPEGTFTEIAAKSFIEKLHNNVEIVFYPTISKVFNAIGNECELGIIPIENTLDGFVQTSMDLLLQKELKITYELVIPVQFSFVSNSSNIRNVQKVFAQFKAQGQCVDFLSQFDDNQIITTASNGKSYESVINRQNDEAAIIPRHMLQLEREFPLVIENITDSIENETRFIVISKNQVEYCPEKRYKTSVVILTKEADEPGLLSRILNVFSENGINLTSIMSQPTKKMLGKYHFFMDIEGYYPQDKNVKKAMDTISEKNILIILGSYFQI